MYECLFFLSERSKKTEDFYIDKRDQHKNLKQFIKKYYNEVKINELDPKTGKKKYRVRKFEDLEWDIEKILERHEDEETKEISYMVEWSCYAGFSFKQ